jgi:hypothetical protein
MFFYTEEGLKEPSFFIAKNQPLLPDSVYCPQFLMPHIFILSFSIRIFHKLSISFHVNLNYYTGFFYFLFVRRSYRYFSNSKQNEQKTLCKRKMQQLSRKLKAF